MCCRKCWAPQAVCQRFKPIDNSGRMRYKEGDGRCQFVGVLKEAVAIILSRSIETHKEAIQEWVREQSQKNNTGQGGNGDEWDTVFKPWLGSSVVQGGVEMSGMCWLFCAWATKSVDRMH